MLRYTNCATNLWQLLIVSTVFHNWVRIYLFLKPLWVHSLSIFACPLYTSNICTPIKIFFCVHTILISWSVCTGLHKWSCFALAHIHSFFLPTLNSRSLTYDTVHISHFPYKSNKRSCAYAVFILYIMYGFNWESLPGLTK